MSDKLATLEKMLAAAKVELEASEPYERVAALEEAVASLKAVHTPVYVGVPATPQKQTVQGLAAECVVKAGEPQPFRVVFDYIDAIKNYPDKTKGKANLSSVLSKGGWMKPVQWKGNTAWWPTGRPLPSKSYGPTPQ